MTKCWFDHADDDSVNDNNDDGNYYYVDNDNTVEPRYNEVLGTMKFTLLQYRSKRLN